jgi:CheY-like chemotaxis protein
MKTVLLIDDDDFCRAPASAMLRKVGWNVIEAADGERGIELAIKHRPDVILCDLLMPRGNGYHVCRAVREQMELRHTKVVVITGRDFAADRQSADEAGVDDYLVKPIEFEKLREVLQRLVPGAPEQETTGVDGEADLPKNEATRVKFWGVRGSIPTPGPTTVFFGGNTSCVELRADGEIIILDAGSGIRPLGHASGRRVWRAPDPADPPGDAHPLGSHPGISHSFSLPTRRRTASTFWATRARARALRPHSPARWRAPIFPSR